MTHNLKKANETGRRISFLSGCFPKLQIRFLVVPGYPGYLLQPRTRTAETNFSLNKSPRSDYYGLCFRLIFVFCVYYSRPTTCILYRYWVSPPEVPPGTSARYFGLGTGTFYPGYMYPGRATTLGTPVHVLALAFWCSVERLHFMTIFPCLPGYPYPGTPGGVGIPTGS